MSTHDELVGVVIVPDHLAKEVRDFAASLEASQTAEVEGFRAGLNIGGIGEILGRPSVAVPGGINMLSGSDCSVTGPVFKPNDFNCTDED